MKLYLGTRNDTHDTSIVSVIVRCDACSREDPDGIRCSHCLTNDEIGATPLTINTQRGAAYPKSPDGHAWGYGGSGPSQLALDLLWDFYDREPHPRFFQAFKRRFIEPCRDPSFGVTEREIRQFESEYDGGVKFVDPEPVYE